MSRSERPLVTGDRLVLASSSATRAALLAASGIGVDAMGASIDERAVEADLGDVSAKEIAMRLAEAKALAVSALHPHRLVLGADQTLEVEGLKLHKASDRAAARETLLRLSGRTHRLYSGLALAQGGTVLWSHVEEARLAVRPLSNDFIEVYLDLMGNKALSSVGAYQYEGLGIHLFERIEGDQSTILGLPLLPLLAELRRRGLVLG